MIEISSVDEYSYDLLNKAKRFFEKGTGETNCVSKSAYYQAAVIFSIMFLETIVFSISEELCNRPDFSLLEKSLLLEKDIVFNGGAYSLSDRLKMSKITDKITFLLSRFNAKTEKNKSAWWSKLKEGIKLRNDLIHPKTVSTISSINVENTISAVLKCADELYKAIYKRGYPHYKEKLTTAYDF